MKKQPVFSIFLALVLGILIEDQFHFSFIVLSTILLLAVVLLLCAQKIAKLRGGALLLIFFGLGILVQSLNSQKPESLNFKGKQNFTFVIQKKLRTTEKNRRYIIEILQVENKKSTRFSAILNLSKTLPPLDFRHRYTLSGYINAIDPPEYDYQFHYEKYMARQHVFYQIFTKASPDQTGIPQTASTWVKQRRLNLIENIDHTSISKNSRDFMKGITLADQTEMDSGVTQDFSRSGLAHLLAISGTHMAIIFWFLTILLKFLMPARWRIVRMILSLVLIWMFAVFIDYGPSVVRSCLMITTYYIYVILQRKTDLLHALGLAGFIILVFDSQQLFTVGFQLSFVAVFGIYWLNQPILKLFPNYKQKWKKTLVSIMSVTLSAQMITLPLVLYYFHQFSLVSVLSNLVVLPLAEVIILFSMGMVIGIGIFGNVLWLNALYDQMITVLLKVIHLFADFKMVFFDNIPLSIFEVLAIFLMIYFLRFLLIKSNYKNILQICGALLLFAGIKLYLDYQSFNVNETLLHHYAGKEVYSVKTGDRLTFYADNDINVQKLKKSIANPYAVSVRIQNYQIVFNDEQ